MIQQVIFIFFLIHSFNNKIYSYPHMYRRQINLHPNQYYIQYELQRSIQKTKLLAQLECQLQQYDQNNSKLTRQLQNVLKENQQLKRKHQMQSPSRHQMDKDQTTNKKAWNNASRYLNSEQSLKGSNYKNTSYQNSIRQSRKYHPELGSNRTEKHETKENHFHDKDQEVFQIKNQRNNYQRLKEKQQQYKNMGRSQQLNNNQESYIFSQNQNLVKNHQIIKQQKNVRFQTQIDKIRELSPQNTKINQNFKQQNILFNNKSILANQLGSINPGTAQFKNHLQIQKQNQQSSRINNSRQPQAHRKWFERTDFLLKATIDQKMLNTQINEGKKRRKTFIKVMSASLKHLKL